MKILQVIPYFYPALAYGGTPKLAYGLSKALATKGHEVTVFTTDAYDRNSRLKINPNEVFINGMQVRYFRNISNRLAWNRKMFISPGMFWAIREELKTYDIVHLHEYRSLQNAAVHHYAMKYGVPYVLQVWGLGLPLKENRKIHSWFDSLFGYRILRDATRAIATCVLEADEYKEAGISQDRIALLPMGGAHDLDEFSQLPAAGCFKNRYGLGDKHVVVFLGRIHWIKGLDFLVQSFHELAKLRDDIILAIVGPDDGYRSVLEGLITESNLSDKVLFTGFLDGEDKMSALVDADMLVLPSVYESGIVGSATEAVLCDTPIIVSKDTGAAEDLVKMGGGYAVEYGNNEALADMMKYILDSPAEAKSETQKIKEYIKKNLSWESKAEEYEKLYTACIKKGKKSGG